MMKYKYMVDEKYATFQIHWEHRISKPSPT